MNTSQNPIRVLLIDDHKSFMDGLTMLINTNKSVMRVVATAGSRDEALEAVVSSNPDVALLDVDLGNDHGIELLPELIARCDCKFIILTGALNPEIHESAILRGARGVLLKTDSAQTILKAIEKVHDGEIWLNNSMLSRMLGQLTQQKNGAGDRRAASAAAAAADNPEARKIGSLTARERAIISILVNDESSTNKEIAARLFISDSTLKNHLTTIYAKLGVRNRIDLLKYALTHKLNERTD